LQSRGDPRGELVVLDAHDRAGETLDREALDRLLVLAAEHGFPPFDTDADLLVFRESNGYVARIGERHIHVSQQPDNKVGLAEPGSAAFVRIDREDGPWSHEETNVILAIVLDAIRGNTPAADVRFPDRFAIRSHPRFRAGPFPTYAFPYGFRVPLMNADWRLRARDRDRWLALWERR
jgi:hypothetical protein